MKLRSAILIFVGITSAFASGAGVELRRLPKPDIEGYFQVAEGREIYARLYRGKSNKPAIVFVNGLTQDTEHWASTLKEARRSGRSVVLFDTFHQGRSLERHIDRVGAWRKVGLQPILPPLLGYKVIFSRREPIFPAVPIEQQALDLAELLRQLKIDRASFVGLSYGGALSLQLAADRPDLVEKLILVAPYVEPMAEQDQLIRYLMGVYRRTYPLVPLDESELYDFFLRGLVLSTYHLSEPSILKWGLFQPYAASELARGVRMMAASDLVKRLNPRVLHLVIAGLDPYIQREVLIRFWESAPKEVRASLTVVEGIEHKANESVGPFLGGMVSELLAGHREMESGHMWLGIPEKGVLKSASSSVAYLLPKSAICESKLLRPGRPSSPNLPVDRIVRNPAELLINAMKSTLPEPMRTWFENTSKFWLGL